MQKTSIFFILSALVYSMPIYCNVIWPAMFIVHGLFNTITITTVIVSILIEGALFYIFIRTISPQKAFFISCISNAISMAAGFIMPAFVLAFTYLSYVYVVDIDSWLGGTFSLYNQIFEFFLMFLGTILIELVSIWLIFKLPLKRLLLPVIIGNTITYSLVAYTQYPSQVQELKKLLGIQKEILDNSKNSSKKKTKKS